jgi:signal transduction histidine kinase
MATLEKQSRAAGIGQVGSPEGLNDLPNLVGRQGSPGMRSEKSPENGLASFSHELRNLLTALNLYSELLAEPGVLSNPYRHMAGEIKLIAQAGRSLLNTLNRLQAYVGAYASHSPSQTTDAASSADGCKHEIGHASNGIVSEHQLAPVLDSCLPLLANLAGPQIHVHLECAKETGCLPFSSEDLTLILVNLVRNAAEAMPAGGGVWIAIQPNVEGDNGSANYARIVVEDDGPGIPVKARGHLFESGYTTKQTSLPNDQTIARERHGLGLAIVRQQVESAGGVIQVRSASVRGGARFEIRIPVTTIKGATKVADELNSESQTPTTDKKEAE